MLNNFDMENIKIVSLSELRFSVSRLRKEAREGKIIVCTHYGAIAALLVSIKTSEQIAISSYSEIGVTNLRVKLTEVIESLDFQFDCVYLKLHDRRVAALVSPRLASSLIGENVLILSA